MENNINALYKCEQEKKSLVKSCILLIVLSCIALSFGYYQLYQEKINNAVEKRILINRILIYKCDSVRLSYTVKMIRTWNTFKEENHTNKEINNYIRKHKKIRVSGIQR